MEKITKREEARKERRRRSSESREIISKVMLTAHFSLAEMLCKCGNINCDASPMLPSFMAKLEQLRLKFGQLTPTSAMRCKPYNKIIGGAFRSQHLLGNACDFYLDDPGEFKKFVDMAIFGGFKGIGASHTGYGLVHIDDRDHHSRWFYP